MSKRPRPKDQPLEVKQFKTVQEIDHAIAKFKRRIQDAEDLRLCDSGTLSQEDDNVDFRINSTILEVFGENSPQYRQWRGHEIGKGACTGYDTEADVRDRITQGIRDTVLMLNSLIDQLKEKKQDLPIAGAGHEPQPTPAPLGKKIFIVHGCSEGIKEKVARFLEKLGLEVIILHEKANLGDTIIEKLEHHTTQVAYAVVLLTGDDQGGLKDEPPEEQKPRARQNVILELGLFIGKLGRKRVCSLVEAGVERPSDIEGVIYIPFDPNGAWKLKLAQEIRAAGLDVDLNNVV